MKKLRILTKSLLFLSFFMPFIILPNYNTKHYAGFIEDSLAKDSIMKDSLAQIGQLGHYLDSLEKIKTVSTSIDSTKIVTESEKLSLTKNSCKAKENQESQSFSGARSAINILACLFCDKESPDFLEIIFITLPLAFIITLLSLFLQFFKTNLTWQSILSLISLIFIIAVGFEANAKNLYWGFYAPFILNLLDIVIIYLSMVKVKASNKTQPIEP